jgi:hypothetical protein
MEKHLFLRKANDQLISHCNCRRSQAHIGWPSQADCPWCGCGWLFDCCLCSKAFTFAEAFVLNESWETTAHRILYSESSRLPDPEVASDWVCSMRKLLKAIEPGKQYVYLDGKVLPTTARRIRFRGRHSRHYLGHVPHVAALDDPRVLRDVLCSTDYWVAGAIDRSVLGWRT